MGTWHATKAATSTLAMMCAVCMQLVLVYNAPMLNSNGINAILAPKTPPELQVAQNYVLQHSMSMDASLLLPSHA